MQLKTLNSHLSMDTPSPRSVTGWIEALKIGNDDAADALWQRYFDRVVKLARKELGVTSRRVADEEDVAVSVFRRLCNGVVEGHFSRLTDRDDLWRLLAVMTAHRATDQTRRNRSLKRGGDQVRGDSAFDNLEGGLNEFLSSEPTPEFLAMLAEEHQRLMDRLPEDALRQVAEWKMDGLTNGEIAERMGVTRRSVERKLNRIRQHWAGAQVDD